MPDMIPVDAEALRADVREKYRDVALHPDGEFHFHTGRPLAARAYDVAAHVFLAICPA